jgi:hypothetical protein
MENYNSEQKRIKKSYTFNPQSRFYRHVISILHDGGSCNIDITYQPILAVTGLVTQKNPHAP